MLHFEDFLFWEILAGENGWKSLQGLVMMILTKVTLLLKNYPKGYKMSHLKKYKVKSML